MNIKKIYLAIGIILFAMILAYFYPHPILWLLFILLLIALLPTILLHLDMVWFGPKFISGKGGLYKEIKIEGRKFLDRHFNFRIVGKEDYEKPVIFVINHSFNDIVSDICLMTIKTKNKIIKVARGGFVKNLFKNIEHIVIDPSAKNRTEGLLNEVRKARDDGYSVIIFPEGQNCVKKTYWRQLMPFKTGTFVIAKELNMMLVPVIITSGKYNNGLVTYGPIEIHYLDPIDPNEHSIEELRDISYEIMSDKLISVDV